VFEEERRRVNRWKAAYDATGDYEQANDAERDELKVMREEKRAQEEANFRAFDAMVQTGMRTKAERAAAAAASRAAYARAHGEALDELEPSPPVLSNEGLPVTAVPEHPTLQAKREQRRAAALAGESGNVAAAAAAAAATAGRASGGASASASAAAAGAASAGGGFFAAGASADGPDPLRDERAAREAKSAAAAARLQALLADDIWPELSHSDALPDAPAATPPPPATKAVVLPPPPPPAPTAAVLPPPASPAAGLALPPPPPLVGSGSTDFDELD
jgi:hypothetical protein